MPQLGKDQSLELHTSFADRRVLQKYFADINEALICSYQFTMAETWEDLDRAIAVGYVEIGLERVRQQHLDADVPHPLDPSAREHRVHYTLIGLIGRHPAFEELRDYVRSRAAFQRLNTLDDLHLEIGRAMANVKGHHAESFEGAQLLAWMIVRSVGVLQEITELTG